MLVTNSRVVFLEGSHKHSEISSHDSVLGCVSTILGTKCLTKHLKDGRVCLAHSPKAQQHIVAGEGWGQQKAGFPRCIHGQEVKGGGCCCSVRCLRCIQSRTLVQRMVPLIFRVSLPNSIHLIQITPHRQAHTLSKCFGIPSS